MSHITRRNAYLTLGVFALITVSLFAPVDTETRTAIISGAFAFVVGLWMRSGRSDVRTALLIVPLLFVACQSAERPSFEIGMRVAATQKMAAADQMNLFGGLRSTAFEMTPQLSNPISAGMGGLYANSTDGRPRLVSSSGVEYRAGTASDILISAGTPGSAVLGSCWSNSADGYKLTCKESAGNLRQRFDGTAPGTFGCGTPGAACFSSVTMSGQIAMGGNKIVNLGTPTLNTDATTKAYVDAAIAGPGPQSANTFFAGPSMGVAATPTWRQQVAADLAPVLGAGTGALVRPTATTYATRTLVAGSNIGISNADFTMGNPTISFSPSATTLSRILYDSGTAWIASAAGVANQILIVSALGVPTWTTQIALAALPAHASTHLAAGSDPLLAAPGPIGGMTPSTVAATTITASTFNGHATPGGVDTLVSVDQSQTLTNKTLASPVLTGTTSGAGKVSEINGGLGADVGAIGVGCLARTAANTPAARTITAADGSIAVANGNCAAGNPTVNVNYGTPVSTGAANSAGVAPTAARSDHVHQDVVLQTGEAHATADFSTAAGPTLITGTQIAFNKLIAGSKVWLNCTYGMRNSSALGATTTITLYVDAAPDFGTAATTPALANSFQGAGITRLLSGLAAGAHTFDTRMTVTAGTGTVAAASRPTQEHASCVAMEVRL